MTRRARRATSRLSWKGLELETSGPAAPWHAAAAASTETSAPGPVAPSSGRVGSVLSDDGADGGVSVGDVDVNTRRANSTAFDTASNYSLNTEEGAATYTNSEYAYASHPLGVLSSDGEEEEEEEEDGDGEEGEEEEEREPGEEDAPAADMSPPSRSAGGAARGFKQR